MGRTAVESFRSSPNRISRTDQRWQLVFGDYVSILLVKNLSGGPMIERLDLFQSRTYIVYEPPLPLLPSAVNLVGSAELQTGYRMYNRETGKLKRSGRVIHSVKRAGAALAKR